MRRAPALEEERFFSMDLRGPWNVSSVRRTLMPAHSPRCSGRQPRFAQRPLGGRSRPCTRLQRAKSAACATSHFNHASPAGCASCSCSRIPDAICVCACVRMCSHTYVSHMYMRMYAPPHSLAAAGACSLLRVCTFACVLMSRIPCTQNFRRGRCKGSAPRPVSLCLSPRQWRPPARGTSPRAAAR